MQQNTFNYQRLTSLLRREISTHWLLLLFPPIIGTGAFVLDFTLNESSGFYFLHFMVLAAFGIYFQMAPQLFIQLHPFKSIFDLTLPASSLEKYVAKLLLVAVVVPVILIATTLIMAILYDMANISSVFTSFYLETFTTTTPLIAGIMVCFAWTYQAFFVMGAIYFRKYSFLKTLLIFFVVSNVFSVLILATGQFISFPLIEKIGAYLPYISLFHDIVFWECTALIFYILQTFICWYIGYRMYKRIQL